MTARWAGSTGSSWKTATWLLAILTRRSLWSKLSKSHSRKLLSGRQMKSERDPKQKEPQRKRRGSCPWRTEAKKTIGLQSSTLKPQLRKWKSWKQSRRTSSCTFEGHWFSSVQESWSLSQGWSRKWRLAIKVPCQEGRQACLSSLWFFPSLRLVRSWMACTWQKTGQPCH